MNFSQLITAYLQQKRIPEQTAQVLQEFYAYYQKAFAIHHNKTQIPEPIEAELKKFVEFVAEQIKSPFQFDLFHEAIRKPYDYYAFGLNVMRHLVDFSKSKLIGKEHLDQMELQLKKNENVILFANHQTEPDPQAISLLLGEKYSLLAESLIFVAGHRVVSDPLAIPFSMGRNLLCIYSKKHIENPPELKQQKLLHNQKTLQKMVQLLSKGGQCIYVAPSGGRDRKNAENIVEVAPFDPQSIELFYLMTQQADQPTHFYPLALYTYNLQPPPQTVEKDLGERRQVFYTPICASFGAEIDMEQFPGQDEPDKKQRRIKRSDYIYQLVKHQYQELFK